MKNILLIAVVCSAFICKSQTKGFYWNIAGGGVVSSFAEGIGSGQIGYSTGKNTFYSSLEATEIRILWSKPKMIDFFCGPNFNYQYNYKLNEKNYIFGGAGLGFNYFSRFIRYEYELESKGSIKPSFNAGYKYCFRKARFVSLRFSLNPMYSTRQLSGINQSKVGSELMMPFTFLIGFGK